MPHFGIPLLGHGTVGGFLDQGGIDVGVTGLTGTRIVTGTPTIQATLSESFQQARAILDNILSGAGLPQTSQQIQTSLGISSLEQQSQNVTSALNELITVREQDIKKINENFRNFAIASDVTTEGAKSKASTITESLKAGLSDLQIALGGTGLVIGIIIVGFIILKK